MRSTRRGVTLVAMGIAALTAASVCGQQEPLAENWYAIYMMGQKAGYQHEVVVEEAGPDGPTYRTDMHVEFALKRANVPIRFIIEGMVREDAEGRVLAFRQGMSGAMSLVSQGRREDDQMVIESRAGGLPTSSRVPAHDGLGPWALQRLREKMGHEPETTFTARAFSPEAPATPVVLTVTIVGKEDVQVFEVTKRLHRADSRVEIKGRAIPSSEWFDDSGTVWLITVPLGGMVLECRKATEALATSPDDPADILAESFVRPNRPIPRPRSLDRLRLLVKPLAGDAAALGLESGPFQEAETADGGVLVTLRRAVGTPELSYPLPYDGEEHAKLVRPNVLMESEDPLIVRLTQAAVGEETDALKAARRIEAYVRETITAKNLNLGFASAVEAASQRTGDCSEHAVLAAAMARAAGMPSRVIGGLVYVAELPGAGGGGFGYHMWAEVFVGEWLPIDAALGGHDATHLALVRSGLNGTDDLFNISAAISRVFGCIAVDVLEEE